MTGTSMPLIELLQKQADDDFLRVVAEAVLQLLMEVSLSPGATKVATVD